MYHVIFICDIYMWFYDIKYFFKLTFVIVLHSYMLCILRCKRQGGYCPCPWQTSRFTHCMRELLIACGSADKWSLNIQRRLWHRWLMSLPSMSISLLKTMKLNLWAFTVRYWPVIGDLNLIAPYPFGLGGPFHIIHSPFGPGSHFEKITLWYFW